LEAGPLGVLGGGLHLAEDGDLQGAEGAASVTVAGLGQVGQGLVGGGDVEFAVAALGVGEGPAQQQQNVFLAERLEPENGAAAQERRVQGEERVLGRGADENDDPLLDIAEEDVLLSTVEAMQLVDEEDGAATAGFEARAGLFEGRADVLDAAGGGVELGELGLGQAGNDAGQRRLADAGRTVEDDALEAVGLDHAAQELAGTDKMVLARKLVEVARPHADGQGGRLGQASAKGFIKQILSHKPEIIALLDTGPKAIPPEFPRT